MVKIGEKVIQDHSGTDYKHHPHGSPAEHGEQLLLGGTLKRFVTPDQRCRGGEETEHSSDRLENDFGLTSQKQCGIKRDEPKDDRTSNQQT
jgi:hypothetical protein